MQNDSVHPPKRFKIKRLCLATILAWTILAIITAIWECSDIKAFMISNAQAMARVCIEKDIVFRRWAAGHGGVYVPVTDKTPPNPWLNVVEREIVTPSGRRLTLMNPAYMTRQIFEIGKSSSTTPQGHITSLKPIRPENAPDAWETRALKTFETGVAEYGGFWILDGKPVYRYMRPLFTEKSCLRCHSVQEYNETAVHGGISIAIPTADLELTALRSNVNHVAIITAIWLMGLVGIGMGFRRINADATIITAERDNLSSVFESSPMPMLLIDDRMEVVRFNSLFREYCNDHDEALPNNRCGTLLKCVNAPLEIEGCGNSPACDSCNIMRALREVLRSGLPARGETSVMGNGSDGSRTESWLLYCVEAVALGGQIHALMSFMDISERKREESMRRAKAEEFRALVENSPDAIARYDRRCSRIYVNPAMEHLANKSKDLLTGKTPTESFVANHEVGLQVQKALERVFESGVSLKIELSWKDSDDNMRHFDARYIPEFDADGGVASILGITRDITSLRKTEAQLLQAQKMESVGTLAGGVAHDFNNILSVIGGYSDLLQLTLKGDEKTLSFANEITNSVARGAELTRSLLAFSGKHEPQKQDVDLNQIVSNLEKSMSRLLRSDIALNFELCGEGLPVLADRFQIEQVLINLLVNARDALTFGGTIQVTTSLVEMHNEVEASSVTISPGIYGLVTVSDNGIGMDQKTVGRIFEPFFTTKELGKGTGLGLSIAYGIVGNHNGRISVESVPGKGSVIGVYLPISEGNTLSHHSSSEFETPILHGHETVLLVDDDPDVLRITSEILVQYGYTVLTAVDGLEALELFEEYREEIRAAVIDMIMPRMNGREAIKQLRNQDPDLPIILASGYTDDIIDSAVIDELNVVFLPKPVDHRKLVAAIRSGIGG